MNKQIFQFFVASTFFVSFLPGGKAQQLSEGNVVVEWDLQTAGEAAKSPVQGAFFQERRGIAPIIIDADTTPASPFPDGHHGLFVKDGPDAKEDPTLALSVEPFTSGEPPAKGWIEMEFLVQAQGERSILSYRTNANLMDDSAASIGIHIVPMENSLLVVNKADTSAGKSGQRFKVPITPDDRHILRLEWDLSDPSTPHTSLLLDGEPLNDKENHLQALPSGVARVAFFLKKGMILGRVIASE